MIPTAKQMRAAIYSLWAVPPIPDPEQEEHPIQDTDEEEVPEVIESI